MVSITIETNQNNSPSKRVDESIDQKLLRQECDKQHDRNVINNKSFLTLAAFKQESIPS